MEERVVDPQELIDESPMSRPQIHAVALTGVLSALDGYDLLSITFVAPDLARAFQVDSSALGLLLSSGLAGALVGSLVLAALADLIGRRPVVLISLTIMAFGMLFSAFCDSIVPLVILRFLTGIGIGAMVVVINPIAVEFSNKRMRSFAISMMVIGFPIGGTVGGLVAALLLRFYDWRAVFLFGAAFALLLAPLVIRYLPESLSFLLARRSESSLARVNALLGRFGHQPMSELPPPTTKRSAPYRQIFRGAQLRITAQIAAISFLTFLAIYYFVSWQPKILVDLGVGVSTAATIAGASSFAGACGGAIFGVLSRRIDGRTLAVVSIIGLGVSVVAFGSIPPSLAALIVIALLAGSCAVAATVGLYVTVADAFEPRMRATGTGFIIGVGRAGSALGPALAGALFASGGGRAGVSAALGAGALVAGAILIRMRRRSPAAS